MMFSSSKWSLWVLLTFLTHLSPVLSFSRSFRLTNTHNAVCLKVEQFSPETTLKLEFPQPETDRYYVNEIPVVIFRYKDLLGVGNLPNFINFTDSSYTNIDNNGFIQAEAGSPDFFFFPGEGSNRLPSSLLSTVAKVFGDVEDEDEDDRAQNVVTYKINNNDTYCVYLPRYAVKTIGHDPVIYPHPFQVEVTINGETLPHNIDHTIALHTKLVVGLASLVGFMVSYHTFSGKSFTDIPIIAKSIIKVLALSGVYYAFLLFTELLVVTLPRGSIQVFVNSVNQFVSLLEGDTIYHIQDAFLFMIYVGYGTIFTFSSKNNPMPLATKLVTFSLALVYLGSISLNHFLVTQDNMNFQTATLNSKEFEVFDGSMVFPVGYQVEVLNGYLMGNVDFIKSLSSLHMIATILLFVFSLYRSVMINFELKKLDKNAKDSSVNYKSFLKTFRYSILIHFFLFKVVLKQVLGYILIQKMAFFGYFDFNRLLDVVSMLSKHNDIVTMSMKYVEFAVLWAVWGIFEGGLTETETKVETSKHKSKKNVPKSKKSEKSDVKSGNKKNL